MLAYDFAGHRVGSRHEPLSSPIPRAADGQRTKAAATWRPTSRADRTRDAKQSKPIGIVAEGRVPAVLLARRRRAPAKLTPFVSPGRNLGAKLAYNPQCEYNRFAVYRYPN